MKRGLCLLFSAVFIVILFVGCNKVESLQDTFKSNHTNGDIIKILTVNNEDVVLYTSDKNNEINAAEYSLVNKKWKMVSDVLENNVGKLSFGFIHKGQKNEILFGKINDPNIKKVQVKKENGEILNATITNKNGRFYWYVVWAYGKANLIGLNKDGHYIYTVNFS